MDKRTFAALFLLIFSGMSAHLYAQAPRSLTLQQALNLASLRNKEIQYALVIKKLAEEELHEQKEAFIPEVNFHASYARITNLTSFPTGLKNVVVDETIPEWADVTATASLPLYEGGAIKNRIKKAKQELKMNEILVEKTQNDTQIEVVANFLGIFKLMEMQKLIQENIAEEKNRLKEVRVFRKQGTVTSNEVLRTELQLSNMELKLLSNKHHIEIALHQLQTILQFPEDEQLQIDTANLLNQPILMLQNETYMKSALQKDEMRLVSQKEAISKTNVQLAKSNFFPKISVIGSYVGNYPNYMFFPPEANIYTFGKIGLEATWSISGMYKNKTKVHIAHLNEEKQHVDADIMKDRIMNNVFSQYSQLQETLEKLSVMERAQQQATENYRIVKVKYLHQLALITDMIDADNALLQAQFNLAAIRIDVLMKHYELRYAAGLL